MLARSGSQVAGHRDPARPCAVAGARAGCAPPAATREYRMRRLTVILIVAVLLAAGRLHEPRRRRRRPDTAAAAAAAVQRARPRGRAGLDHRVHRPAVPVLRPPRAQTFPRAAHATTSTRASVRYALARPAAADAPPTRCRRPWPRAAPASRATSGNIREALFLAQRHARRTEPYAAHGRRTRPRRRAASTACRRDGRQDGQRARRHGARTRRAASPRRPAFVIGRVVDGEFQGETIVRRAALRGVRGEDRRAARGTRAEATRSAQPGRLQSRGRPARRARAPSAARGALRASSSQTATASASAAQADAAVQPRRAGAPPARAAGRAWR